MRDVLKMALAYADRGWHVFPTHALRRGKCTCAKDCSSPAKHPVTKRGLLDAATEPDTIRDWWRRWPWANVAIATGQHSGIVVLDVDTDKGGTESLDKLATEVTIPATLTSHTGGGGLHLVFTHPGPGKPVKTRARAFGPGLDVRGDGGYIVAPPSTHITGNTYTWKDEATPIAPFPVLLRQQLEATTVDVPRTVVPLRRRDGRRGAGGTPYGMAALHRMVDELLATTEGARNYTLNATVYAAARLIAGGELEREPTLAVLSAAATGVGLGRVEIDRTIASAVGAGTAAPKTAPPRDRGPTPSVSPGAKRAAPDDGWVPPDHEPGTEPDDRPDSEAPPARPEAVEIHDFLNADEEEYDWLIPGLLERGDRVILTGPEGGGKSTLLRQLAIQAGAGMHPFNKDSIDPVRVLYVDLENARSHVRRQLNPLVVKAGDALGRDLVYVAVEPAGIDLLYQGSVDWLTERITESAPALVIIGPLYKLASGDPTSEEVARKVSAVLDGLRSAHGFALLIEAHSPHASGGGRRPVRPYGASMWLRWPEFGIYLADTGGLTHWRGPRDEREWPTVLKRGMGWPWTAVDNPREELMHRIVAVCEKKGHVPSERVIADTLSVSKTSVHRAIEAYPAIWAQVQETFGETVT